MATASANQGRNKTTYHITRNDHTSIDCTPYTYTLKFKPTGEYYYGVRFAKGCHPSELGVFYYSSSREVEYLMDLYGEDSFEYKVRKVFTDRVSAKKWEQRFLLKVDAANHERFINKCNDTNWKEILPEKYPKWRNSWNKGKKLSKEHVTNLMKFIPSEIDIKTIIEIYNDGNSIQCLGDLYNITDKCIRIILQNNGVILRTKKENFILSGMDKIFEYRRNNGQFREHIKNFDYYFNEYINGRITFVGIIQAERTNQILVTKLFHLKLDESYPYKRFTRKRVKEVYEHNLLKKEMRYGN